MQNYDLIAVGETMVMVTPTTPAGVSARTEYVLRAGGAESNVALHLARLGHRTAWAGIVGDDPLGGLVLDELAAGGVEVGLATRLPGRPTGLFLKHVERTSTEVLYYRVGSAASTMSSDLADALVRAGSRILHLSGITPALSESCDALVERLLIERRTAADLVAFDVNYRARLWPDRATAATRLRRLGDASDICFVGLDEATALWGRMASPEDVRGVLPGPEMLIVKDAGIGATAFVGDRIHRLPAPPVDIVETVGAGDAFAAGYLSGLLRGADPSDCLALGHAVAAHVLTTTADDIALPAALAVGSAVPVLD